MGNLDNFAKRFEPVDIRQQTSDFMNTSLYSLSAKKTDNNMQEREVTYYFDIIKSHRLQMQSQITDYWLENNTAVQDTINISPLIITLEGLVGEVVYAPPKSFRDEIISKINSLHPTASGFTLTSKLSVIGALIPSVDNYTQLAKNAINYTEAAYKRYKKLWDSLVNPTSKYVKSRQKQIFETFNDYWQNRVPLTVQTPYGVFERMYIQNVDLEQGETNTVSNLSVTLKQLNFAEVQYTKADKKVLDKVNSEAREPETNLGKAKSIAKTLKDKGGNYFRGMIRGLFNL